MKAYEDVSQKTSNVIAQQKIADGIKQHGLGDAGGMVFGMNMLNGLSQYGAVTQSGDSLDQQIANIKKLKELLDAGILAQEEFDVKKRENLGL